MKKIVLVIAAFLFATLSYSQEIKKSDDVEMIKVEVNTFKEKAPELVGKIVEIQGMATHVCKHGGDKMFIMNDNPEIQVKITRNPKMAAFVPELEGSTIWVKGIVQEMEVEMEAEEDEVQDEAHKNIYHVKQYSIEAIEYQVINK